MPTIRKNLDNAAGAATLYPLTGSQYEYLPFRARLRFAVVATGTSRNAVTASIYSGSDVLQQGDPVQDGGSTAAYTAKDDEDFLVTDVAAAGERISVEVAMPAPGTAGTADTYAVVVVQIIPA